MIAVLVLAGLAALPSIVIFTIILTLTLVWGLMPVTFWGCVLLAVTLALVNGAINVFSMVLATRTPNSPLFQPV